MNLFLSDRRKNRRIPFPVRAKLNLHGKICRGRGKNISLTGATLRVEDPPPLSVGQSLQLYLGNESFYFNVEGTVRGIQEPASCPADHPALPIVNVAIQFTNFSRREQQVLGSLIEGYQDRAVSLQIRVSFFHGKIPSEELPHHFLLDTSPAKDLQKKFAASFRSSQLSLPINS